MTRRLAAHVHVHDEHGAAHVFGPGDDVPAWAVEAITNPAAWAPDPDPGAEPEPEAGPGDPGLAPVRPRGRR